MAREKDSNERKKTRAEILEEGRRLAAAAKARVAAKAEMKRAEVPEQLFLPGIDEAVRAMPNHVARSSLYAPIARGKRRVYWDEPIVTRSDVTITYTGEQLDEADADLTLQLLYTSLKHPLGAMVAFKPAPFLRAMGRSTGKSDYMWLHRRLKALAAATLFIEAKKPDGSVRYSVGTPKAAGANKGEFGDTEVFRILDRMSFSEEQDSYFFVLDRRWRSLFGNREFAFIDWEKRLQIGRGQDMAKALQRLVATSADLVQRYALEWLKEKMQYSGRMRDFEIALERSLRELERVGVIAAARIDVSTKGTKQAVWTKLGRDNGGVPELGDELGQEGGDA
jgi:hypothetical protein